MDLRLDRDSEASLATQLAWRVWSLIDAGELRPGDRLPSVRAAAASAGVNVNTVRAAYARLERDRYVSTEHGRGTFVAPAERAVETGARPGHETAARRAFRDQIAALEAELARRPPPPSEAQPGARRAVAGALLSAHELETVRDALLDRLQELDAARARVLRRLEQLPAVEEPQSSRHATPSRAGARIRWVGA